jgi:hypothetical protein
MTRRHWLYLIDAIGLIVFVVATPQPKGAH